MSTYTPIASQTLSAAASSVTFSGIPQTYTDLVLVISGKEDVATGAGFGYVLGMQYNSDTGSNYSVTRLDGNGSSAVSDRFTNQTSFDIGYYGGTGYTGFSTSIIQIMNYSNSTTYKTMLNRMNLPASGHVTAEVGLWRNTAAVTSIKLFFTDSNNIASGSTFNLYGIDAQASAQAKATGGQSIYTDGTYWYHIFNSSGTFTPSVALSNVDYLVVAGGGGGGASGNGGGGGAGGLRCTVTATGGGGSLESKLSLLAQSYAVTVGAGGAGIDANNAYPGTGYNGSNSIFSTITSTGGGGGGAGNPANTNGATGGSGGGAGFQSSAGAGTANQGYGGGGSSGSATAGGGGGAGAAGSGKTGGNGVATSITGSSITYAGGGGGGSNASSGSGGSGGGGSANGPGNNNGTVNLGGGAGGGSNMNTGGGSTGNASGGNGGSGIVVIRYPV